MTASAVLAACGSSGGTGSSQSTGSAAAAADSPVTVMVLGSIQSSILSVPGIQEGVQAAADSLNAAGGLNGHKIKVVTCNDQANINQAEACARQAVTDKAIAVVGSLTLYGDAVIPVLQQAGIPDVAPFPISPSELKSTDSFPVQGGNLTELRGVAEALKRAGVHKVSQLAVNSPTVHQWVPISKVDLQSRGIAVTKTIYVSATQTDMSSAVTAAAAGGVQGIATNLTPAQMGAVLSQAKQQGIKPVIATTTTILSPDVLKPIGSAANGTLVAGSFPPLTDTSVAAIRQFSADMAKYEPGKAPDDYALNAWAGMQLLKVATAKLKNFSPASVTKALGSLTNVSFLWLKHFSTTTPNTNPTYARVFNQEVFLGKVSKSQVVVTAGPITVTS